MCQRPRRNHTSVFKTKMALAVIRGEYTFVELAQKNNVHANQIKRWRYQLLEGTVGVFDRTRKAAKADPPIDAKTLHAKIGELALENDF